MFGKESEERAERQGIALSSVTRRNLIHHVGHPMGGAGPLLWLYGGEC